MRDNVETHGRASLQQNVDNINMIKTFFQEQLAEWPLANQNYEALNRVKVKDFDLGGAVVSVQFNPERMRSSAAKVDTKSIQERKCFLCPANLPPEQRGIPFGRNYQILVNPFPIFPVHLTIPDMDHVDQLILGRFGDMLELAKTLDDFVVFYNGPKCGASAPDHIHFQAGNKDFLPLEKEVLSAKKRDLVVSTDELLCFTLPDYHRSVIVIESANRNEIEKLFKSIYGALEIKDGEKEPMLNIVTWFEQDKWIVCVFPREVHRPACFFAEGDDNILISPASVDLSGVCVLPQEKDFDKIRAEDIKTVFSEICISKEKLNEILKKI
ncbi:hypothetical protein SDC9_53235 [bioreactor metagenome]|uniref:DUF4922 domain-containing protein n=1 Tax=bioreactor metagenome TaxID=1076179 RepID=A0A644WT09_9ZZZZ